MYHVRIDSTFMLLCWFNGLKPSGPGVYVCGIMNVWGLKYSQLFFLCVLHALYQEWSPEANRTISRKERNSRIDDVTLTNIVSAADEAHQTPQDTIR